MPNSTFPPPGLYASVGREEPRQRFQPRSLIWINHYAAGAGRGHKQDAICIYSPASQPSPMLSAARTIRPMGLSPNAGVPRYQLGCRTNPHQNRPLPNSMAGHAASFALRNSIARAQSWRAQHSPHPFEAAPSGGLGGGPRVIPKGVSSIPLARSRNTEQRRLDHG